jgi:hypothetical protein
MVWFGIPVVIVVVWHEELCCILFPAIQGFGMCTMPCSMLVSFEKVYLFKILKTPENESKYIMIYLGRVQVVAA